MKDQSPIYEYEDIEQARMARNQIKEIMKQFGEVLQQRRYYEYLKIYYDLLNKDVGEEEEYYE
ncbi:MAG: hypothetical protein NTY74_13895 [Ignavibacteriae bacterium]|nr:hypothetical protein [Ignavibacteriota bacterium]